MAKSLPAPKPFPVEPKLRPASAVKRKPEFDPFGFPMDRRDNVLYSEREVGKYMRTGSSFSAPRQQWDTQQYVDAGNQRPYGLDSQVDDSKLSELPIKNAKGGRNRG